MNDLNLVEEYFRREFTEAEKRVLDELIERSPEAARLFVEKSKAAYQPHALPELKLPPQPIALDRPIRFSKWWWVLGGYGLLATAFWFWSRNHDFYWPWDREAPVASVAPAPRTPPKTSSLTTALLANETAAESDPAQDAEAAPEDAGNDAVDPIPVTALSPSILEHPGLRVIVNRPIPGRATVTVLDATGKEIRFLYSGVVQAGQWAFEWDGRRSDGSRAPIGNYTLQVRSGPNMQKQEVWIGQ